MRKYIKRGGYIMEKIAVITDTASDLSKEYAEKNNINVLPFKIIYKDREYRDGVEISASEVYETMGEELPTTSIPSLEDMENVYKKLIKEGYTHVIGITLSSELSGIHNALRLVSEEYTEIKSHIFDSKSISIGESYLVEKVVDMINDSKSYDEIVEVLPSLRDEVDVFFVFGTLEYLVKGGRIGKVAGTIGEMLNLKPIINVNSDGVYETWKKVRGRKKSIKAMYDEAKIQLGQGGKVMILHGGAQNEADKLYLDLKEHTSEKCGSVKFAGGVSPVSGVHTGPGLIGCVIIKNQKELA